MKTITSFLCAAFLFCHHFASAQIIFPKGNNQHIIFSSGYVYFETNVAFSLTSGKITDYAWNKLADSIDTRWIIDACMNGTCKVGLPDAGPFESMTSADDTFGFIKFHIETNGFEGSSKMMYRIYKKTDPSIQSFVSMKYTYDKNATGIQNIYKTDDLFHVYPIPANMHLSMKITEPITTRFSAELIDLSGKTLTSIPLLQSDTSMDVSGITAGLYTLHIFSSDHHYYHRVSIHH
jgi:hypothetical protein